MAAMALALGVRLAQAGVYTLHPAGMRRARCTRSVLQAYGQKWCWRLFHQRWQLLFDNHGGRLTHGCISSILPGVHGGPDALGVPVHDFPPTAMPVARPRWPRCSGPDAHTLP